MGLDPVNDCDQLIVQLKVLPNPNPSRPSTRRPLTVRTPLSMTVKSAAPYQRIDSPSTTTPPLTCNVRLHHSVAHHHLVVHGRASGFASSLVWPCIGPCTSNLLLALIIALLYFVFTFGFASFTALRSKAFPFEEITLLLLSGRTCSVLGFPLSSPPRSFFIFGFALSSASI